MDSLGRPRVPKMEEEHNGIFASFEKGLNPGDMNLLMVVVRDCRISEEVAESIDSLKTKAHK